MIPEGFHRWRWRLLAAWCVLFTALAAWGFHTTLDLVHKNATVRVVACARQDHLRDEVASSVKYLQDIHTGVRRPIPGITEADILHQIQSDRVEIIQSNKLHCERG